MHWTKKDIINADRVERLNLINAITGIKPGNLIGTVAPNGKENLAIFSSVVHLGSNPALIGFILRPSGEVPRNTYENICSTGYYTINHLFPEIIEQAHYTSAKFPKEVSEFEVCALPSVYLSDFPAPFVRDANIKIGLHFVEEIGIPINGTSLIVGEVEHVFIENEFVDDGGHLNLEKSAGVGISGLNTYYSLQKIGQFPYARVQETPKFQSYEKEKFTR